MASIIGFIATVLAFDNAIVRDPNPPQAREAEGVPTPQDFWERLLVLGGKVAFAYLA